MSEPKYTKGKLEVSGASLVTGDFCIAVIEDDGGYEAPLDEREANAARLALCWNCHDELVDATKRLLAICRQMNPDFDSGWQADAKIAIDALALARNEGKAGV